MKWYRSSVSDIIWSPSMAKLPLRVASTSTLLHNVISMANEDSYLEVSQVNIISDDSLICLARWSFSNYTTASISMTSNSGAQEEMKEPSAYIYEPLLTIYFIKHRRGALNRSRILLQRHCYTHETLRQSERAYRDRKIEYSCAMAISVIDWAYDSSIIVNVVITYVLTSINRNTHQTQWESLHQIP